MPEEKKGLFATLKERWDKFKGAGASKKVEAKVPQRKAYKRIKPRMNPEQEKATRGARQKTMPYKKKRPAERKPSRSNAR